MYINKCSKCGAEFETKNPKRVICPACLYPDRNPLLNNQENNDSNQEKQQDQNPQEEPKQKAFNQEETSQQGEHRPSYNREGGGYNRPQGGYNRDGGGYNRPQGGYNRDGGNYNREGGGYNRPQGDRPQGGYNRDGGNYNREGGGYNRPQGDRPQGGYNRDGGGYNRPQGGYNRDGGGYNRPQGGYNRDGGNYNREGGGYNRPQGDRPQGGFNRDGGGYNRPQGGGFNRGGGYNRPQGGGFNRGGGRPGGFNRGGRPAQRALLVSREQVAMIEVLYKRMLPLPNPDAHEIIGAEIGLEPNKVFFGINLVRQKLHLPKLPFPKRKLAITPEQLMAIKSLYEPLLPLPPIGCHKIIAGQLKMDEWRVHVGIGLVRKQLGLDRWNQERDDVPPELIKKAEAGAGSEAEAEDKTEEKPAKEKKETKKK